MSIPTDPQIRSTELSLAPPEDGTNLWRAVPAWLVSLLVHVSILLVLGLVSVTAPVKIVNVLTASPSDDEGPEIEEFTIEEVDPGAISELEQEPLEPTPDPSEQLEPTKALEVAQVQLTNVAVDLSEVAAEISSTTSSLQTLAQASVQPLSGRSKNMRKQLLRKYGGSKSSEAAVAEALKWLAAHQLPSGAWTFQHNLVCNNQCGDPGDSGRARALNGATALALLPFLGAGQTHLEGDYRNVVLRGLRFLIQNGKVGTKQGIHVVDYTEPGGTLYSHGLATITLSEAYALTQDPELLGHTQGALNFISYAQASDGGWRYRVKQNGDTSVTGWQLMALKSGDLGHLQVPTNTVRGAIAFLDKVGSDGGAIYGYDSKSTSIRNGCVAIGLLCRMYTGWDKTHPGIVKGVNHLHAIGVDKRDIYYNYYAAQVLKQYGGEKWDQYNLQLRDWLVKTQSQQSGSKGSWHFPKSRSHRGPVEGGRLASTAFSTMILEVYYRHLPLYSETAIDDDFPL